MHDAFCVEAHHHQFNISPFVQSPQRRIKITHYIEPDLHRYPNFNGLVCSYHTLFAYCLGDEYSWISNKQNN
jgi:hypothetical protein